MHVDTLSVAIYRDLLASIHHSIGAPPTVVEALEHLVLVHDKIWKRDKGVAWPATRPRQKDGSAETAPPDPGGGMSDDASWSTAPAEAPGVDDHLVHILSARDLKSLKWVVPTSFVFVGREYPVTTWSKLLMVDGVVYVRSNLIKIKLIAPRLSIYLILAILQDKLLMLRNSPQKRSKAARPRNGALSASLVITRGGQQQEIPVLLPADRDPA